MDFWKLPSAVTAKLSVLIIAGQIVSPGITVPVKLPGNYNVTVIISLSDSYNDNN